MKRRGFTITGIIEYVILVVGLVVLWSVLERTGTINPVTLPAPESIFQSAWKLLRDGTLLKELGVSILRVLKGYGVAAVSGIVLGIAIGLSGWLNRLTDLLIQLLKPIPPIAWIPLAILWFGTGEGSKVFLIFLGGFFNILINVIDGIRQTDQKLIEVSENLEVPKRKFIVQLVIPAALPGIFTGLRTGIGACWMCVVAAELIASTQGIGYLIMNARQFSKIDIVIVGMIAIGLTGKLMDVILKQIERRVIKWEFM